MKKLGWRTFAVVFVLGLVFFGGLWALGFASGLELEYGYYGQFNRVKHVIEDMPGVTIVDHWQHRDVTLEDFSFTLATEGGRQVQVDFIESSPQMQQRDRTKLREFIQDRIDQETG